MKIGETESAMAEPSASNDDQRLSERLRGTFGPTAADLFTEAADAMARASSATTLVTAHMMREIESSIRAVLEPAAALSEPRVTESGDEKRQSHREQVERIGRSLDLQPDDPFLELWFSLVGQLHSVAHRSGQHGARPVDPAFVDLWQRFRFFAEAAITVAEQSIARHLDELDRLLAAEPTRATVKTLAESMPHGYQAQRYFFEALASPEWLPHLRNRGYFRTPYAPTRVDDGLRFLSWPQAGYLLKVAELRANDVGAILGEVELNSNWAATHELCNVALAIPPETATPFVRNLTTQVRTTDWLPLFDGAQLGRLAGHVAKADSEAALDLLSALLAVFPDSTRNEVADDSEYRPLPRPRPRIPQDYDYEEVLNAAAPALSVLIGLPWIELLIQLVAEVIELSYWSPPDPPLDQSYIWFPTLDSNTDGHRERDARGHLVSALRDSAAAFVGSDVTRLQAAVHLLWSGQCSIFRRVALHLLATFGAEGAAVAEAVILADRTVLDDGELRNEAGAALRSLWPALAPETKERLLSWIEAGRARDDDDSERRQWWQYRWLLSLRPHLDARREALLETLAVGRTAPEDPDRIFATWTTSWGPETPYTASELEAMSVEKIRQLLETWTPADSEFGVDRGGLGREFRVVAARRASEFAYKYRKWFGLRQTYIRQILEGWQDAQVNGQRLPWKPVLELCGYVLAQPWETASSPHAFGDDPDWSWARKAVASLLESGLRTKHSIPARHRVRVWSLIERLLEDSDPSPESEMANREGGMDAFRRSINSVRGVAAHAACYYGTWLHHRRIIATQDFSEAPELRLALERRLDVSVDGSACVRSVLAHHFRRLYWLDAGWAVAHADEVFHWDPDARILSLDVWHAYAGWGGLVADIVDRLLPNYSTALGYYADAQDLDRDCRATLAHLAVMWLTSIPARANVAVEVASLNDDRVNAAFVDVLADVLSRRKRQDRAGDAARVEEFWRHRLELVGPNAAQHQEELMELVSLFVYEGIPLETALMLLSSTLDHIQPARGANAHRFDTRRVLHRLVNASSRNAAEGMRCLAKMIRADTDGVLIMLARDDIRSAVSRAHRARHAGARREAQVVANLLVGRGQLDYRQFAS